MVVPAEFDSGVLPLTHYSDCPALIAKERGPEAKSMTLTTHGVVGGAIVSLMPNYPVLGLCLAFASHFLLDRIPHWDYPIRSPSVDPNSAARMRYDRALLADMATIGADAALGVGLALLLFATKATLILVAAGACAALLPDVLQFAYIRYPHEPLASLQRFHRWAHTTNQMDQQPILGVASQVGFLALCVVAAHVIASWI
jgi:hypothetical protein